MASAAVSSKAVVLLLLTRCLLLNHCEGSVLVPCFCCAVLCALSIDGERELVALLCLSCWCLVTVNVLWLFLMVLGFVCSV